LISAMQARGACARTAAVIWLGVCFLLFPVEQASAQERGEVESRVEALVSKMTLDEKLTLIGGINDFFTQAIPRLGIPELRMSDGPLGVHDYGPTTAYPAGIALAASWDTDLAKRVGASMGQDARARGVNFVLAPGMNIYRAPMNGRNFEYFGEDPFLAARMAVAMIEGIQGQGVIATAKHYAANNQEYGRMDHSSDVDERTLREIYLPAFEASVKEGKVGAIMDAYNLVNGVYMTENGYLNNVILKKEWGFNGIVMSDWGATHDGIAAAKGGLDLEMPSGQFMNKATLLPAIQRGEVSVAEIDDKVRRILRKAIEFGFYDREQTEPAIPLYSQKGREVALEEARSGMVLLKNENSILPLDKKKIKTIAVIGPDAYPAVVGGGGSSLTKPFNSVSYLEGISNYVGENGRVLYTTDDASLDEIVDATDFVTSPGGSKGLTGEYFNNDSLQGAPALVRTDEKIGFHWGEGSYTDNGPVDRFSVRWTGYFIPLSDDDYKFYVSADDGVRLYLNDDRVIDDWQRHAETLDTYATHLDKGKPYKIRLEYFEAVGTATARFGISAATKALGKATKALVAKADAVVLCVGFDPSSEGEGGDRTFALPGGQDSYIQQIVSLNKNVVVVLTAGGNVDMTKWIDSVPALIHAWYAGQEGGTALAQILFGKVGPSGKLPASFEQKWQESAAFDSYYPKKGDKHVAYKEGVFSGYRHFDRSAVKPLFPFGFGLSYTKFQYSDLVVAPGNARDVNAPVSVSFRIKNVGAREGAEIAELYVGDAHASVPRPVKELKGFAKVNLRPGESRQVLLKLDRRAFSFFDVSRHDWIAEPGEFAILVGSSSAKMELHGTFVLDPEQEKR
jgi:beta-glucosidase